VSEIFHKGVNWCGRLTLGCRTTVASVIEHYSYFGTAITDKKRHHAMSPCPRRGTVAERGVRRKFVSQYGVIVGISSSSEYKKGVRQHFGVCAADPQELTVIRSLAFATSAVVCLFICLSVCLSEGYRDAISASLRASVSWKCLCFYMLLQSHGLR